MAQEPRIGPAWADLVFHVLAHVKGERRFASSLHSARYTAFCERHLGPTAARALGQDVTVLSQLLTSHELTARLQWIAFLFPDAAAAREVADRELRSLVGTSTANPAALRAVAGDPDVENAAELLRAAAELEAVFHARLPPAGVLAAPLAKALAGVGAAAPQLASSQVVHLRALTRHGRALPGAIYVGVPSDELGVTAEWTALQAAHEATVVEVGEAAHRHGTRLGERDLEHAALVVLAERAQVTGLGEAHSRWWAGMELPALDELRATLGETQQRVVAAVRGVDSPRG